VLDEGKHNVHVMRIGLIGGECTGKSTLARDLAAALPGSTIVVPEVVRAFVHDQGRPPHADEQAGIMAAQAEQEAIAEQADPDWLIADPAPAMTAIYSHLYFDDDALLPAAQAQLADYDIVLWCDVDLPWQPDPGQRDGAHMRAAAHAAIAAALVIPSVHLISGSPAERLDHALRLLLPLR
jgi:nicotinamide riboside kinase